MLNTPFSVRHAKGLFYPFKIAANLELLTELS